MEDQAIQWFGANKGLILSMGSSLAAGYLSGIVVPPSDVAVWAFRAAMKFPPFRAAVRKNPEAVKAAIDAIETALDKEVDAVKETDKV